VGAPDVILLLLVCAADLVLLAWLRRRRRRILREERLNRSIAWAVRRLAAGTGIEARAAASPLR
jgi:hypothetical protein